MFIIARLICCTSMKEVEDIYHAACIIFMIKKKSTMFKNAYQYLEKIIDRQEIEVVLTDEGKHPIESEDVVREMTTIKVQSPFYKHFQNIYKEAISAIEHEDETDMLAEDNELENSNFFYLYRRISPSTIAPLVRDYPSKREEI